MINLLLIALLDPSVVVIGQRPEARNEDLSPFTTTLEPEPESQADLGEALEGAAGARVRREGGAGRRQTLQLRGGGGHQVGIFLDDIPLQSSRGGAFDLSRLPIAWVEEAELVRGPAAARWGGGAQAGVLRLESRRAPDHVGVKLGSYGLAQLDGGLQLGSAGFIAHVSRAEGDFPFTDTNGARRARQNNDHLSGGLLSHARIGAARLVIGLSAARRGEPGPEQFPREAAWSDSRSALIGLSGSIRRDLHAHAYTLQQRSGYEDPEPPAVDPQRRFQMRDGVIGGGLRWDLSPDLRLIGAGRVDHARTTRDQGEGVNATRPGGALTLSHQRWWTPWLASSAVLRGDANADRDPILVPQLGIALKPSKRLYARLNLGRIFRDPGFDELYYEGIGARGNPNLRPEDGWSGDVGFGYRRRIFEFEAVAFAQRYSRLILFVPKSAYLVEASDEDGARVDGLEGRLKIGRRPARLTLSYTRLRHAFDHSPHAPLPHRADHQLYAKGELLLGPSIIHGIYDWRGEVTLDRGGARRLPSYGLAHLGASAWLGSEWRLGGEIRNLLDAQALDALQAPRPGRTFFLFFLWRPSNIP